MSEKKKQLPLRISGKLYGEIASWAEDDFRSINGQIEYLLTECVKKRKQKLGEKKSPGSSSDKIELKLDEADKEASLDDTRHTNEEVFSRVKARIKGED